MESTPYVFSFRMVFFYLVTTGWTVDIGLCENSINRSTSTSAVKYLKAKVLETKLYGCVTWSPRACHDDTLRRAHHRFLTRCIGWRKHKHADHPTSYLDTLIKTGSESIEATLRRRRILFAGFVARMEDTRLRHQRRPVDEMAQNGRTRGGKFHGEMDRCREKQGWTTACSGMPERDGKGQEEDSPKQAGLCWFARPC